MSVMNRIEINAKGERTIVPLTPDEIADAERRTALDVPSKQSLIDEAESKQTMRLVRGAVLGDPVAITNLQAIEDEIKAIR